MFCQPGMAIDENGLHYNFAAHSFYSNDFKTQTKTPTSGTLLNTMPKY